MSKSASIVGVVLVPGQAFPTRSSCRSGLSFAWIIISGITLLLQLRALAEPTDEGKRPVDLTEVSPEQLMSLKVESVYGASRYEQRVSQAPSAVTIITADEIAKFGHRTLADVLQSVNGLYVNYDRNYNYLGVRGFNRPGDYSSRVLVLVDGHRVNETVFDAALIGQDFILDVDNIQRVEVIPGPSSSIYGNNAFFGVINVITKQGNDIQGAEASAWGGSFGTYNGRFTYGDKLKNGLDLMISGSVYNSDGPENLYYPEYNTPWNRVNNGIAHLRDWEESYKVFTALRYSDFELEGGYNTRTKGVPTGSFGTIFNDPAFETTDDRAYVTLGFKHSFENDWVVTAHTSFDHYHYDGAYPLLYTNLFTADERRILYQDYALGNSWSSEVQVNKKLFDKHTLTLGGEFRDNFQQDQGNEDNDHPPSVYKDRRQSMSFGLYNQAEIQLHKQLTLNAGFRYDYFDTFGDTLNPRIGLIYQPIAPTTLKLLYGTAFNAPNVYELYYTGPSNLGNPDLRPETITTYEAVLEQRLHEHLEWVTSGYYYEISDLINQSRVPGSDIVVYNNLDEVSAYGIEPGLRARWANGFQVRLGYAYQKTEDEVSRSELSNSPRHMGKLNVIVPFYKDKVFGGFELQYRSEARTLADQHTDPFWLANLTLFSQRIVHGMELSASVYNLFNTRYYHPGAGEHLQDQIEQDGTSFRVKVTYRF